jgi:hypothetical protein
VLAELNAVLRDGSSAGDALKQAHAMRDDSAVPLHINSQSIDMAKRFDFVGKLERRLAPRRVAVDDPLDDTAAARSMHKYRKKLHALPNDGIEVCCWRFLLLFCSNCFVVSACRWTRISNTEWLMIFRKERRLQLEDSSNIKQREKLHQQNNSSQRPTLPALFKFRCF